MNLPNDTVFSYKDSLTPVINWVSASSISEPTTISLMGFGLGSVGVDVFIGDYECVVTFSNETLIMCDIGHMLTYKSYTMKVYADSKLHISLRMFLL